MSWSSATGRCSLAALLLAGAAAAQRKPAEKPPKLGKPQRHPFGIIYALPQGWTVEDGASAFALLPPGVKLDPNREDNPEVYVVSIVDDFTNPEDPLLAARIRDQYAPPGTRFQRDGEREVLSAPGRPGIIYTWDFLGADRLTMNRVRAYVTKAKSRMFLITASGVRDRVGLRDSPLKAIAFSLDYSESPPK